MVDGYGYYGFGMSAFRDVLEQWASFGVFDVLLPLLLVFVLVFAILEKISIFNNRGVNLIIALVLAFFAVTNPYVSVFFMYLFSNLAIGIAILLVMIVLLGVSLEPGKDTWNWVFGIGGLVLLLIVLAKAGFFNYALGSNVWYWMQQNAASLILLLIVVGVVVFLLVSVKNEKKE
ncbi:MAG: hypothetical protein ACPLXC_01290 [Candidatus Pacearchaeota archaeon]